MTALFANGVYTTIAAPGVANGAATTIPLTSAAGWPTPSGAQFVPALVVDTSTTPETVKEIVYITGLSGTTATVTRAAEDATRFPAGALAAGLTIAAVASAAALAGLLQAANNLADLTDVAAARAALGLGTAATHPATDFDAAGAATTAVAAVKGLPLALTGAVQPTRYVGRWAATGAPAAGTFAVGDFGFDGANTIQLCTGAGTPGTWVLASGASGTGLPSTIVSRTTAYTATAGDFVLADATSAGFTVTLPTAPTTGALVTVKKTDGTGNIVTVAPAGGGTVDGDANATIISPQFGAIFEHTGSNVWKVVAPTSAGGANGTNGNTVLTTSGAPASGTGVNGDFAYDPTAKIMYGPKAAGAWPGGTSLQGSAGANGTNGAISQIQDEGSNLTVRPTINFVGAGVTATDDSANSRTLVTIPGGGGGSFGYPFGDGSDGDVTISGTTTLTRDMHYNNLTIGGSGVLKPDGYRIFVAATLTVNTGGVIHQNGTSSANNVGGGTPGSNTRPLTQGGVGANSGTTTGTNAAAVTGALWSLGGQGGTGGTAAGGSTAGGAGGSAGGVGTFWSNAQWGNTWRNPQTLTLGNFVATIQNNAIQTTTPVPGTGGGSGASGGVASEGGGGGGGGGMLVINARTAVNNGTISANGGNGGPGQTLAGTGGGGGGGGGGGCVFLNTTSFTGTTPTASGGTGGAGSGTGAAGSAGAAGTVHVWVMA